MEFTVWRKRMRAMALAGPVVDHPFLKTVASTPTAPALRRWAEQDYYVSRWFPQLLGILIGQVADPTARQHLITNLWEEHGEGDLSQTHHQLFQDLLISMGLSPDTLPPANAATSRFIRIQEEVARANLFAGLGAFCYGNEFITIQEFAPLESAVASAFPAADLAFFRANRQVDARHAAETEAVIDMLDPTPEDLEQLAYGAQEALTARAEFYDALMA